MLPALPVNIVILIFDHLVCLPCSNYTLALISQLPHETIDCCAQSLLDRFPFSLPLSLCSFPLYVWVLHPPILSTDLPYNVHPISSSYRYTFSFCVSLSSSSKLYSNRALCCAIGEDSQDPSNGPTLFIWHTNWLHCVFESDSSSSLSPTLAPSYNA